MRLLLMLLPVIALIGGAIAGEMLRMPAEDEDVETVDESSAEEAVLEGPDDVQVVRLERRLIVPIVTQRETRAVVLIDVAVEVPTDAGEAAHSQVPRLRDAFLRTMLSLAAGGAFDNGVPSPDTIEETRRLLRADARRVLGLRQAEVLILEALVRSV
ncbi:MAG: hypothetical protein AAF968_09210 [Pseudomonadota bacterium]